MEALPVLQGGHAHVGTEEESLEACCWISVSVITAPAPAWQAGMALLPGLAGLLAHQPQLQLLLQHPHLDFCTYFE